MASERISALRHRYLDLRKKQEEVNVQIDKVSEGIAKEDIERVTATVQAECDDLRDQLSALLEGRVAQQIDSQAVLEDANSLLSRIILKRNAIYAEILSLGRP